MLKKFVETLQSHGENSLKVIFISSDQSEHDMWKYIYDAHGDWMVLAYSCRELKERLERQYQVSGIPNLVVIDAVGRQAVRDARGEVMAASSSSTQVLTTYLGWKSSVGALAAPSSAPTAPSHDRLTPGLAVRICGLQGAPEHNSCEGTVQGFDPEKQRYVVQLGEKSLSLRAANLLQLPSVQLGSGQLRSEWRKAQVVDFDTATGVFTVRPDGDTATVAAKLGGAEGLVLEAKTRVVVQGLLAESAQQWNEHVGEVLDYDEAVERYLVKVAPNAQLKIRPGNVRIFPFP